MLLPRDHELSSEEGLFVKKESNDREMFFLSHCIGDKYDLLRIHKDLTVLSNYLQFKCEQSLPDTAKLLHGSMSFLNDMIALTSPDPEIVEEMDYQISQLEDQLKSKNEQYEDLSFVRDKFHKTMEEENERLRRRVEFWQERFNNKSGEAPHTDTDQTKKAS